MSKQTSHRQAGEPSYRRAWTELKQFPRVLHEGSHHPPTVSGPAAAALISGGIGAVTMMVVHHLSDTSKQREDVVRAIGSWIPGSINPDPLWGNIGSYAGKETCLLLGWLVSWIILHQILKHQQVKPRTLFVWMLGLFTVATAMAWHPLFPYLPLM